MFQRFHSRRLILLLLLSVLVLALLDSNFRLTVTDYTVASPRLPESFDGFTIVQISDLHARQFGRDNGRLVELTARQNPDLIVLTGDFIESEEDIPITRRLVEQLKDTAPVYFVSGNHDWACHAAYALRDAVTEAGGVYLSNAYEPFTFGGAQIVIAGVEDPNSLADLEHPDAVLARADRDFPGSFILLLAHRNNFPALYPDLPCDLILTGHGHGGVVRLPGLGGVFGPDHSLFPPYDKGVFPSGRYRMVVSAGLAPSFPVPRLLNPPELVRVTLKAG